MVKKKILYVIAAHVLQQYIILLQDTVRTGLRLELSWVSARLARTKSWIRFSASRKWSVHAYKPSPGQVEAGHGQEQT